MITNNNFRPVTEVEAMKKLEQANALHTTLPMEDLIAMFAGEIRDLIEYDSFEFENQKQPMHLFLGTPKLHKCRYRVTMGDMEFGLITFTRATPFEDKEINLIEGALGALTIHLGNAMHFQLELSADSLITLQAERRRGTIG